MRRVSKIIALGSSVLLCGLLLFACRTPAAPPTSQFSDDWTGLFLTVTKSFGVRTYYIGSDDKWSYFQTRFEKSLVTPTYRKVETSRMSLRRTFAFREGAPYRIELTDFGHDYKDQH